MVEEKVVYLKLSSDYLAELLSTGIAIGVIATVSVGLIAFAFNKLMRLMLGK